MKIEGLHHASIKLIGEEVIYFDPYNVKEKYQDADYIFITHDHYDHYDKESIENIRKEDTKIIVPTHLSNEEHHYLVEPNKHYEIDDLIFDTVPSYNIGKPYHPKEKGCVGYNIYLEKEWYYIMGDTDITEEAKLVKTDICFVPIGGVFTMDVAEASEYIQMIKPKKAIPIHYGQIVGDISLGEEFQKRNQNIEIERIMEE